MKRREPYLLTEGEDNIWVTRQHISDGQVCSSYHIDLYQPDKLDHPSLQNGIMFPLAFFFFFPMFMLSLLICLE